MQPEFEIASHTYRFDGMPPQAETRILRRMAMLIGPAIVGMLRKSDRPGVPFELREDADMLEFFTAAVGGFHSLSDDDTDAIQRLTVGALSRRDGQDWIPVWPEDDARPVYRDINGAILLRLTGTVLGLVTKSWMSAGDDILPASIRDIAKHLH